MENGHALHCDLNSPATKLETLAARDFWTAHAETRILE